MVSFLVEIMKNAWEVILSIFHVETVFFPCKESYCTGGDKKKKKKKKKRKPKQNKRQTNKKQQQQQIPHLPVERFMPSWASCLKKLSRAILLYWT